jgi:hypothetical protein
MDFNLNKMKKINIYIIALIGIGLSLSSCIKNDVTTFSGPTQLEWDAASYNANGSISVFNANGTVASKTPVLYPVLTGVPGFGRALINASDPAITRASGAITFRVNLIGPQQNADYTGTYTILSASTAVSGTQYTTTGTFTIPAHSSFGMVTVNILNPGAAVLPAPPTVYLVMQIAASGGVGVSVNYNTLGISISEK